MIPLPHDATDDDLIAYIDRWASRMEAEEYTAALDMTEQNPGMEWTPSLMRHVVKTYGAADPRQKVTLQGKPTDITQRKEVDRWPKNSRGEIGEIWYDLNIDGIVSDLTATFRILEHDDGLVIELNDIHVM